MPEPDVLPGLEEAPHIEINQDGSTIDLSNWSEPANRNWAYRHIDKVLPYLVPISKGDGGVQSMDAAPADLSDVRVAYHGESLCLDDYLRECHGNALIVLKDGAVVYENYVRMDENERHLCQSVSKTTVCAVIGSLAGEGLIDPTRTVDEYIPDVASGFAGVRLQDLLDMNNALAFDENFANPQADIFEYETVSGWHPGEEEHELGVLNYIKSIKRDPDLELDGVTHYLCPNTDMLVAIAEQVTGRRFAELFEERIYRHIGAEHDALFSVDKHGFTIGSGGLIITLRDLARYGMLFANMGQTAGGTRVIPLEWLDECRSGNDGTEYYLGEGFRYHNMVTSDGDAFCHLGVCGQMLFANPKTGIVVAQFSTTTMPSQGDLDFGNALYDCARAINEALS